MKKRIIYLSFLFLISLFIFGCKNNNIENISLNGEAPEYVYEGFNIESLSLIVTYKDGEVSTIPIKRSMLDKNEQKEINDLGLHHITIEYKGFEIPLELLVVKEKSNYKVLYYLESLEGEYILDSVEEVIGNTYTEPIINKSYDGFYSGRFNSAFIQPDGTTEISVYYQRKSYSIDVVFENQILETYKFKYGQDVKLKEPKLDNHNFIKWLDEIPETMPDRDLVINAELKLINYVCKFVDFDGTVICEVIGNIDTIIQIPLEPTRDDDAKYSYTFSHWDGFKEGMILDGNYVFKAVYNSSIRSYTITFKDYDGSILYSASLEYDERIIYKGVHPERLPDEEYTYEFLSWDKSFNYVKGDEVFTAKYKEYKRYFSVDVDVDGVITNYKVENGQPLVLETPVKKGHSFVKWSHNLSKINDDMTIYAEFSPNYYSITYRIHNSFYKSTICKYGDEIVPIDHLDIEGFYFVEWVDVPKTMPDSDIIINAKYLQIPNVSLLNDLSKVYDGNRIDDPNLYITGKPNYKWEIYNGNTLLTSNPYRAGSYVLRVEVETDDEYLGDVYYFDFEILKRDAKIIVEDKESVYGDDFSKLTYISEGFVTNPIINIEKEEGYVVGEYNIIASCDDRNYNIEIENGIYTITKRNIDVQIINKTSVYKEELLELNYEIIEGNICNNDNLNIIITKEEGLDAGKYEITGTFDNDNYLVSFINGVYTIEKAQSIITMNSDLSYVYDGQTHDLHFTLNHDEEELVINGNGNTNAGEYLVTVSVQESKNYLGSNAEYIYVINKAQSVITGSNIDVVYDGNEYSIEATLNHSEKEIIYFNNTHTNAGEYIVNCKVEDSDNYLGASCDFTIKINKAETILTGSDVEKVYDGKVVEIDCSINHNESAIEFDILNIVDAGTYIVTLTAKESTNYKAASKIVNVVITKAQSVLTLDSLTEYTYDGKIHSIIYKLNHSESEIIYTGNDKVNAGKYNITAEVKETKNYKGISVTNELVINKAETVLTLDSLTEYTYDGKVHSIVYKINHNESEIIYTGNDKVNAGNYNVSIEVKESDNYKGLSFTTELIIKKAESIIETEDITVTYDKATHSIIGTLNHNETQIEYTGNDKVNAGEYVVVLYARETANYKEARKEAKLVINKADSVITLDSGLEFVYNGSVQGIKCKLNHTEGALVYSNNNNSKGGYYNTTVSITGCNNYKDLTVSFDYAIYYSVKLYAYDGTLLYEDLVTTSDEIKYNGIPEMPSTKDYYYEFLGWDVDFSNISSNIVSKALFVKHEFTYTVHFIDANGNVLEKISGLNYGTEVTPSIKPVLSSTDINKAYLFRGFEDINYDDYTFITDNEKLVVVKAITEEVPAVCAIGSLYYGSIFDATIAAEANDIITVIKNNNALYDIYEDVIIPQDVTLYIPYAPGIDVSKPYCDVVEGKMSEDYIYINVNLYGSLTIYGKLVIGGSTGSVGGRIQGAVCGAYSQITTFDGSTINVGDSKGSYSALIECHGYIRDKSSLNDRATINVYANSTIIQPFILTDWLGGTYALNAFRAKTSVFNRYQMPCIEPITTYYLNSLLKGIGKIYAGGQMNQTTFRIFGSEGTNHGLLRLTGTNPNDRIVFDFSSSTTFPNSSVYTDHCDIQIYGDSADRHLQLTISSTNSVSTKNVQFPLHYGLNVAFMEGTFTAICKYKVLPGAVVTVGEKATIKLQSAQLNVYSSYEHPDSDCNYPIAEELTLVGKNTFGRFINNGAVVAQTLYPSYIGGNLEGTGTLSLPQKTKLYCSSINRYLVSGTMTSDDYTNYLYYNGKAITEIGDYKG